MGRAGEDGGDTGLLDADVFSFRAAEVGGGLVLEALAEALGEVSEVLAEAGGKDVAFGFEEEAMAFILVERLIDGCGAAVGWDEEKADGRRSGLRDAVSFLLTLVLLLFLAELFFQTITLGPQFFVDGAHNGTAEGESAFATAGAGGDKEVEVGEEFPACVDGVDVGQAGRYGCKGAQDEHIGIGL